MVCFCAPAKPLQTSDKLWTLNEETQSLRISHYRSALPGGQVMMPWPYCADLHCCTLGQKLWPTSGFMLCRCITHCRDTGLVFDTRMLLL